MNQFEQQSEDSYLLDFISDNLEHMPIGKVTHERIREITPTFLH